MEDPVEQLFAVASRRGGPTGGAVEELLRALDALDTDGLARLDQRVRASGRTVNWTLRDSLLRPGATRRLATLIRLVAPNGYHREQAVGEVEIRRSTAALLLIRTADWVQQVRDAALRRVGDDVPPELLLDLLPLADRIVGRWGRGGGLDALLDAKLDGEALRSAARSPDVRARRAAWRRLLDRGLDVPRDLRSAGLADDDVRVRASAAKLLDDLKPAERRAAAEWLVGDPVGWLAARGLELLVAAEGEDAIRSALISDRATLRRHAREWAAIRGVDAAALYRERLDEHPTEAASLTGLAELAEPEDAGRIGALLDDPRASVRAAALRATATLDPPTAKDAALRELEERGTGRAGRAAARVLRDGTLLDGDLARLEAIARSDRDDGLRLRALALLRRSRWRHLATTLELHVEAIGPLRDRLDNELRVWARHNARAATGPPDEQREAILRLLPRIRPDQRQWIAFVLRTTV